MLLPSFLKRFPVTGRGEGRKGARIPNGHATNRASQGGNWHGKNRKRPREREREREREQWPDGANAFDSIVIVRVYRNKFPG